MRKSVNVSLGRKGKGIVAETIPFHFQRRERRGWMAREIGGCGVTEVRVG